jgi:hypothetical protein
VFTTPQAVDHSTVITGLQASLQLHAIHLLLCRSVRSFVVFFSRWRSLVFVFVVILRLCCLFFCIFSFILLFVLFYLLAMTWFDLEVEIVLWVLAFIWFFAVHAPQLSFFSDGCFTHIGLFTEFLCNLHRLLRPWNMPGLLMVLFELLVITIASCLVLLDRI